MQQTCKKCSSSNIIMLEYAPRHPDRYDGISEIICNDCRARFGRWSGRELIGGETEPRFGVVRKS
jgi:hypothetical protein